MPYRDDQIYRLKRFTKYVVICILMMLCGTSLSKLDVLGILIRPRAG